MSAVPNAVRLTVKARSGDACERCAVPLPRGGHMHHRQPRGMGGSKRNAAINCPSNLLHLCEGCHLFVESRRTDALVCGWLVPRPLVPAEHPVVIAGRPSWTYLDPDGSYAEGSP